MIQCEKIWNDSRTRKEESQFQRQARAPIPPSKSLGNLYLNDMTTKTSQMSKICHGHYNSAHGKTRTESPHESPTT